MRRARGGRRNARESIDREVARRTRTTRDANDANDARWTLDDDDDGRRRRWTTTDDDATDDDATTTATERGRRRAMHAATRAMERENDRDIDRVSERASALKNITVDIHDEVGAQRRMLDEQSDDFARARDALRESARAFAQVVEQARRQGYFWQVVCLVFVFVFFARWAFS